MKSILWLSREVPAYAGMTAELVGVLGDSLLTGQAGGSEAGIRSGISSLPIEERLLIWKK